MAAWGRVSGYIGSPDRGGSLLLQQFRI